MRKKSNLFTFISIVIIVVIMSLRMSEPVRKFLGEEENQVVTEVRDGNFQKVFVTDVVDGDTIWVEIEGERTKIRLIGVNTPEKGEPLYKEATNYTTEALLNQWIYLEKDISDTDQYGRLLRYIWMEIPKEDTDSERMAKLFNSKLLEANLAEVVVFKPDVKYLEFFRQIEE